MKPFLPSLRTLVCLTQVCLFLVSAVLSTGCSRSAKPKARRAVDPAAVDTDTSPDDGLRILAYKGYLSDKVIEAAAEDGMVKIILDTYETEDEFKKKWKDGLAGHDIVQPPRETLIPLVENDAVEPLDKAQIKNFKNLDPKLLGPSYDKDSKFTVPLMYLPMVAMGVRTDLVKKPVKGLDILFDEEYKGKIGIADQPNLILPTFLMHQGHSPLLDGDNPAKVKDLLVKLRPFVKEYASESLAEKLKKGEIWIALDAYSNLIALDSPEEKNIRLLVPETGVPVWVEGFYVAKDTPNRDLAFWFLDYLLKEEVGIQNADETGYATVNQAARAKLEAATRDDTWKYPPAPAKAKGLADWQFREAQDPQKLEALWKEIKGVKN